jgi:hypothetical protein
VIIRREKSRGSFGPDPVLDLPQGARLRIKTEKLLPPKFSEDTNDLWAPCLFLVLRVEDDHDDGSADGEQFADKFELKPSEKLLAELGLDDEAFRNSNKARYTAEQQKTIGS